MQSPFRLLVYAIAAVFLIWVFYVFLAPLFFAQPEPLEKISTSLRNAEGGLGKGFGGRLTFPQGTGLKGESFDTQKRSVVFSCNSASLCCPKGKDCSQGIEWDERKAAFNSKVTAQATARCDFQHGLFVCKVFLGDKPAQVKIAGLEAENEWDLGKGKPAVKVSISNSGSRGIEQGAVELNVFQVYLESGVERKRFVGDASKTENLGGIASGKREEKEITLDIGEAGKYLVEVRASGLEAGFDQNTVGFTVTGSASECTALSCGSLERAGEKCVARCYCRNCMLASGCREAMLEKGSAAMGLPPAIDLGEAEHDVLGSNIIEFSLPAGLC